MGIDPKELSYASEEEVQTRVAWYYYNDGLTQGEIGQKLGISRIKVSRLLDNGRRSGIIQVKINSPYQGCLKHEQKLQEAWGLREVRVIPDLATGNINERLGQAAAQFLMQNLKKNDLLAVGWGATVSYAIQRLGHLARKKDVSLVSLTGGVATYVDGMRMASWGKNIHLLPAPLIVSDEVLAVALMQESSISNIIEMALNAAYQLVGIGELYNQSTILRSGYVTVDEIEFLRHKGAVGDILCQFFDKNGNMLDLDFHKRVIGAGLDLLCQPKNVIAVAGGENKIDAIRSALKGKYIDILITDEKTAIQLLEAK